MRKEISTYLWGDESKAYPYNESGNTVVEILKNPTESRGRFVLIHSKDAKSSSTPNEEERRDEDAESEREESEGTNYEINLVFKTENNILLSKWDRKI